MATNKQALIRYMALDRCLRNFQRRYYVEDLAQACQDALYEYTGKVHTVRREMVLGDLNDMEDTLLFGAEIDRIKDGHRKYYRYASKRFNLMGSQFSDQDLDMMKESLLMLRRLRGLPNYEWVEDFLLHLESTNNVRTTNETVIEFESNPDLIGIDKLEELMEAAINHQTLRIIYEPFGRPQEDWIIHPYYLKQYNSRWFLFGLNDQYKSISNIPIDRIKQLEKADKRFIPNKGTDFQDGYFSDIIGVTIPAENNGVEDVQLQFDSLRFPYIVSKPLHESQRTLDSEKGIIQIRVIPNRELTALILSFGHQVKVLQPAHLRDEIREKIEKMKNNY